MARTKRTELPEVEKFTSRGYYSHDTWVDELPSPLYKFLRENGNGTNVGQFHWPQPTKNSDGTWTPGEWVEVEYPLVACNNGLHVVTAEQSPQWYNRRLFEVEVEGGGILADPHSAGKYVVKKARLVREIETWTKFTRSYNAMLPPIPTDMAEQYRKKVVRMLPVEYRRRLRGLEGRRRKLSQQHEIERARIKVRRAQAELARLQGRTLPEMKRSPYVAQRKITNELNILQNLSAVANAGVYDVIARIRLGCTIKSRKYDRRTILEWSHVDHSDLMKARNDLADELRPLAEAIDYGDIPPEIVQAMETGGMGLVPAGFHTWN